MLEPERHGKAFIGEGETVEKAADDAAGAVYETFGRDTWVEVARVQGLVTTNPRVSEYRVVLVPSDS